MGVDLDGNLDARGKRITNVVDGVNSQDVVTIHQMDTWNNSAKVQAGIATEQAGIATTKANAAAASATSAANSLTEVKHQVQLATDQVGLATVQVGLATEQVGLATTQAGIAIENATSAHTDAVTATEQAGIATEQADKLIQFNELTDRINSVAVSEVGEVLWHHSRTKMKVGCAPGDGQLLLRASYPDLWSMVEQNLVPVVTEAVWQSDVSRRGSYTTGTDGTNFRIPDYNGRYSSTSIAAPVLRGDGGYNGSFIQKNAAPKISSFTGSFTAYTWGGGSATGSFKGENLSGGVNNTATSGTTFTKFTLISPTYDEVYGRDNTTEVRMNSIVGCYVIRLFGVVQNPGAMDAAVVATQLDNINTKVNEALSTGYITQVIWHHSRNKLISGLITGDGQILSRIAYADLWREVQAGNVPVIDEATWLADQTKRNCYTTGDGTNTFRVPDYNGFLSDSVQAPTLRGDGNSTVAVHSGIERNAAPNITGGIGTSGYQFTGVGTGAFVRNTSSTQSTAAAYNTSNQNGFTFDASRVSDVYGRDNTTEVRMNSVVGVWCIRAFGSVANTGNIDVSDLADLVNSYNTRIVTLEQSRGYALIQTTSNMALNSRVVLTNPFGANTPVITQCEIFHATLQKWITTPWLYSTSTSIHGVSSSYSEGEGIVIQTATQSYVAAQSGTSQTITANYTTPSPIRVHVWLTK
nr:phage tail fiber protein [Kluyvera georgiana]